MSIKTLRALLREYIEVQDVSEIENLDPEFVATDDYVDVKTGEVWLEKGEKAKDSYMHPQHPKPPPTKTWEEEIQESREAFERARDELVSNWLGWKSENGDDISPEDVAPDAAEDFFNMHPEWQDWADDLDMTKHEMKEILVDSVYEAMMTGDRT